MDDPYKGASKFETADRKDREQRDEAVGRAETRYFRKRAERLELLSAEAREVVEYMDRKRAAAPTVPPPPASEPPELELPAAAGGRKR